jgi:hypothetical protein
MMYLVGPYQQTEKLLQLIFTARGNCFSVKNLRVTVLVRTTISLGEFRDDALQITVIK